MNPRRVRPYAARLVAEVRLCAVESSAVPDAERAQLLAHLDAVRALLLPHLDAVQISPEDGEIADKGEEEERWGAAYGSIFDLARALEVKAGMRAGGYQRRIEAGVAIRARVDEAQFASAEELERSVAGLAGLLERSPQEIADAMDALLKALKAKGRA